MHVVLLLALLCTVCSATAWATTADDLCQPTDDPCVVSGPRTVEAGSTINVGTRRLLVTGRLDVGPGDMRIIAGSLEVDGELRATGNNSTPGGLIRVLAGSIDVAGTIDLSGSSGGTLEMAAAGEVDVGGRINADHRSGEEGGGTIALDGGTISIDPGASLTARGGADDSGGDVSLRANGDLAFEGTIDVSGGDGGDIDLSGDRMSVRSQATLRTDATLVGCDGGDITLFAGVGGLEMDGKMISDGHIGDEEEGGGSGGTLTIGSSGVVQTGSGALISAMGARPDGFGGDIDISADTSALLAATVAIQSGGNDGVGGSLVVDCEGSVELTGNVDASGDGGGEVDVSSAGERLNVGRGIEIDARATGGGGGGDIRLISMGTLSVEGTLRTDGSNDTPGSLIQLNACTLRIESDGLLSSLKLMGRNVLIGREATIIAGRLRADASTGVNELRFPDLGRRPMVLAGASFQPAPVEVVDSLLAPCAPLATITPTATHTRTPQAATMTPMATQTRTPQVATTTPTAPPAGTATRTPQLATATQTPTPTSGASATATNSAAPSSTPTLVLTPTLPPPAPCVGDCNENGLVSIDELILASDIALGRASLDRCPRLDRNGDGAVTVDEPLAAVTAALGGCLP